MEVWKNRKNGTGNYLASQGQLKKRQIVIIQKKCPKLKHTQSVTSKHKISLGLSSYDMHQALCCLIFQWHEICS